MEFESLSKKISANLYFPVGSEVPINGFPVVIMLHGWMGSKESKNSLAIVKALNEADIAVLRFDFYGHGESGGSIKDFHLGKGLANVKSALSHLRAIEGRGINPEKIGIIGKSIGGSVALLALLRLEGIRVGALICPRSDFKTARPGLYTIKKNNSVIVNRSMMRSGRAYDFYKEVENLATPLLVLHGTNDTTISIQQSEKLVQKSQNAELVRLRGGDHMLADFHDKIADSISQFMKKRL